MPAKQTKKKTATKSATPTPAPTTKTTQATTLEDALAAIQQTTEQDEVTQGEITALLQTFDAGALDGLFLDVERIEDKRASRLAPGTWADPSLYGMLMSGVPAQDFDEGEIAHIYGGGRYRIHFRSAPDGERPRYVRGKKPVISIAGAPKLPEGMRPADPKTPPTPAPEPPPPPAPAPDQPDILERAAQFTSALAPVIAVWQQQIAEQRRATEAAAAEQRRAAEAASQRQHEMTLEMIRSSGGSKDSSLETALQIADLIASGGSREPNPLDLAGKGLDFLGGLAKRDPQLQEQPQPQLQPTHYLPPPPAQPTASPTPAPSLHTSPHTSPMPHLTPSQQRYADQLTPAIGPLLGLADLGTPPTVGARAAEGFLRDAGERGARLLADLRAAPWPKVWTVLEAAARQAHAHEKASAHRSWLQSVHAALHSGEGDAQTPTDDAAADAT